MKSKQRRTHRRFDERQRMRARSVLLGCLSLAPAFLGLPAQDVPSRVTVTANIDEPQLQRRAVPAAPAQSTTVPAPEDVALAQLVPGTLLAMETTGIPEFSGLSLRLDAHGDVSLPSLGQVHLAGLTLPGAQEAITQALVHAEILVAPVVQLTLVQFAAGYVSVLGEVQNPGRYGMIAGRNLANVLALAGGETLAAGGDIEIQHADANAGSQHIHSMQRSSLTELQSTVVQPGDTVYVRRAGVVYVLGAVNKPGGYLMVNDGSLNIYQALALAGGTTLDAAKNGMVILRPHDETFQMMKAPFTKLASQPQSKSQLQGNDVLYVPKSGLRVTLLDGSAIIGAAVNGALYSVR